MILKLVAFDTSDCPVTKPEDKVMLAGSTVGLPNIVPVPVKMLNSNGDVRVCVVPPDSVISAGPLPTFTDPAPVALKSKYSGPT